YKKIKLIYDYYKKYILEGVENYFSLILSKIEIPLNYKKEYELKYDKDSKILILNYTLPNLKSIPNIKEYKYIKTDKKVKDISMSKKMLEELYEDTLYKISLSIIHQIFNADKEDVLSAISLNGIVNVLNKAIGKRENRYILSVQVEKEKFKDINLELVDPKICFKNLGGIACAKLSSITPIKPILTICKEDERFIDRKNVLDYLENTVNLAMIDWQDFEHLMAEFFEKEFKEGDTEVKVTRSSKDGGVDAVIFDSNPRIHALYELF
ncbi:MAG: restriction endonuclease, partial [Clostridiaceae bacterium]